MLSLLLFVAVVPVQFEYLDALYEDRRGRGPRLPYQKKPRWTKLSPSWRREATPLFYLAPDWHRNVANVRAARRHIEKRIAPVCSRIGISRKTLAVGR